MTIGAYQEVPAFAYPGWRITVPGGPAGGHYKGFTHNYSAGTTIEPGDEYEADRAAGASSHDPASCSPRNPRGVYRSSGEVPPRPNASGAAHTYRGYQTARHAGTSVAPGSFPAPFTETDEDTAAILSGLGFVRAIMVGDGPVGGDGFYVPHNNVRIAYPQPVRPNTVAAPPAPPTQICPAWGCGPAPTPPPSTGATSVVNQPPPVINPPAPAVSNVSPNTPISPAPAPVVASPVVVPANDGSGNYIRISDGTVIPPSQVYENPATGQLQAVVGASSGTDVTSWLTQSSIWSAVPNWMLLAGAGVLLFAGKGRR